MILPAALIIAACWIVTIAVGAWLVTSGRRPIEQPSPLAHLERRRALVTLKTGLVFHGLLWSADEASVVLRDAESFDAGGSPRPVDGEAVVLVADIEFVQFP